MTVELIGAKNAYTALASDTKPVRTTAGRIAKGSTLLETDTGREFVYDGYAWTIKAEDANLGKLLRELIGEIRDLKEIATQTRDLQNAVVENW